MAKIVETVKALTGAYVAYPVAEFAENRAISSKVRELRGYYKQSLEYRKKVAHYRLFETLQFAGHAIPYYKELFKVTGFDPNKVNDDIRYLDDLPFLTKDIIREQGDRLLSSSLQGVKHHLRKTGGSTGVSANIYYDQIGLDYSAAITKYSRERIGHLAHDKELHFAARFAKPEKKRLPTKEGVKEFALVRSNVFFDRLDDVGLKEIWTQLLERRPKLVHCHPSTLYALSIFVEKNNLNQESVFQIFESSGELLQSYMRYKIEKVFGCEIINRYGLAEFGVIAYELDGASAGMKILESEGWPESRDVDGGREFVFTGFHNRLMPLIRYATGDMGEVVEGDDGFSLENITGRIHDCVTINGVLYPTHNIMDVMDHIVGGVQEFQIENKGGKPLIKIIPDVNVEGQALVNKIKAHWNNGVDVEVCSRQDFIFVGRHAKFRHLVDKR